MLKKLFGFNDNKKITYFLGRHSLDSESRFRLLGRVVVEGNVEAFLACVIRIEWRDVRCRGSRRGLPQRVGLEGVLRYRGSGRRGYSVRATARCDVQAANALREFVVRALKKNTKTNLIAQYEEAVLRLF